MKPDNNARRALEALLRDAREGMSNAEVSGSISRELDKGEEMDADLVAEALSEAPENPEAGTIRKAANWEAIERKLDKQEHNRASAATRGVRWIRAAAAVFVVFALISVGTIATNAWRWDFLVKVFRPMMDTLGIHMNVEDLGSVGELERAATTATPDTGPESVSRTIRDERQVPKTVRGYAAVPSWLPDGYAFNYAVEFNDYNESSLLIAYRGGGVEMFAQTIVYSDDAKTAINVMEKEVQKDVQRPKEIEIVENDGVINATFEDNLACYTVWGRLSREDISAVITSIQ